MNKEHLETIKKGYQWWLEAENQADKNEFAECITTQDVPALIAEVERLRTQVGTEFFKYGELTTAYEEVAEENARLREDYEATEDLFRRTNEELGYEQEENKRLRDENKKLQKAMIEIKHSNINSNPNQQLDNLHAYCIAVATKALEDEECS